MYDHQSDERAGCLVMAFFYSLILIIIAVFGEWTIYYNFETWVGSGEAWRESHWILRYGLGLILVKFGMIGGLIAFLVSILTGSPIF
jgi:hypothetical protein